MGIIYGLEESSYGYQWVESDYWIEGVEGIKCNYVLDSNLLA